MQCAYNITLRGVRVTIVAVEKAINVTYSECLFVALGIQHAMSMRRILLSVTCPAVQYFSILSHKEQDFRKKKSLLNIIFVSIFSTTFV